MVDISVIVPVYNVERYVERCLRSLFGQTKTAGVEFIIVNDATPDGSMAVVERVVAEFGELDIKVIDMERNSGLTTVRRRGIEMAQGEYTLHIDSDDWCESEMLERLWERRIESGADIVVSDFFVNFPDCEVVREQCVAENDGVRCVELILLGKMHNSMCNKLIRRGVYSENAIVVDEGINMCEDLITNIMLFSRVDSIAYLREPFLHYMKDNPNSITTSMDERSRQELVDAFAYIERYLDEVGLGERMEEILMRKKVDLKRRYVDYGVEGEPSWAMTLFPEMNYLLWRKGAMNMAQRVAAICAKVGFWWGYKWMCRHYKEAVYSEIVVVRR